MPGQHTSSQDLGDNGVTLSTSASLGAESLKHGVPMYSGIADTWHSSSVHQLSPQSSLSLPQISDIAMGSSAPEVTSIAQQHVTMMDNYTEKMTSVLDSDSEACPAQANQERYEIKESKCVDCGKSLIYVLSNGMNDIQMCILYRFKVQICGR